MSGSKGFTPLYPPPGKPAPDAGELAFFTSLANQPLPAGLPMQVVWMCLIAVVFWFVLGRSLFGFRLRAIGGNLAAARLARLPVVRYKFLAFILVAVAATTAGLLDFSYVSSITTDQGPSLLFPTFTAVVIGGASLQGGFGTAQGTLIGALLLAVIANGLAVLAAGPFVNQMLLGSVTVGAVTLDMVSRRQGAR